ncbi:MAG: hypothetical protein ACFFC7_15990 [Candidatus Hermodarchaeota archaeon]
MTKKLIPLIFIAIFMVSNTQPSFGTIILPLTPDGVPFPANETDVYLSDINVLVVIEHEFAKVNASYTFKNAGQEDNVTIYVPYSHTLESPLFQRDGMTITELSRTNVTLKTWGVEYESSCIVVNTTLEENGQTEIFLSYQRSYHTQESKLGKADYYGFDYVIGTRNRWNHSLESNLFEFHIAKNLQPNGFENYTEINDYLIVTYAFPNDNEFQDLLIVGWDVYKDAPGFEGILLFISLFLTTCYHMKLRKRTKK